MTKELLESLRNKLIVFEGGDKTGKTTIAEMLCDYLNSFGITSVSTFQPGDQSYGALASIMRSLCKDKRWELHPLSVFFAFQLDRVEIVSKKIIPNLDIGNTVISDRWVYSTYAYQILGQELYRFMPSIVSDWFMDEAVFNLKPDIVFYFPEMITGQKNKNVWDSFETKEDSFTQRVCDGYEELSQLNNWIKVYPESTPEKTFASLLLKYDEYLKEISGGINVQKQNKRAF